jgi:transposase
MQSICHSVGVDISAANFDACAQSVLPNRTTEIIARYQFKNIKSGFKKFVKWLKRHCPNSQVVHLGMEATGTYHEQLAYHLFNAGYRVSIVLPNRIKHFARSLNEYSKTDPLDARIIADYVSMHNPKVWQPANRSMLQLRALSRERKQLIKMRTQSKNRVAALKAAHKPLRQTIVRIKKQLLFFDQQVAQIEKEMDELTQQDEQLEHSVKLLTSIPYIRKITAYAILAETNCFELFENRSQLIKYAGLDIVEKQSGTSVRGRGRISKRGNANLRSAPYPGLGNVANGSGVFTNTYLAALGRGLEKKQARTAVVRQLLKVAFGVHKSGLPYNEEVHLNRAKKE